MLMEKIVIFKKVNQIEITAFVLLALYIHYMFGRIRGT